MKFKATFGSKEQKFKADFGQIIKVTDGGYEKGYAAGYEEAYSKAVSDVINKNIVNLVNDEIISVVQYLFDGSSSLQKVVSSSLKSVGINSFANCPNLIEVDCPQITSVGTRGFFNSGIKSIRFPLLGYVGNSILADCANLEYAQFDAPTAFSALCFSGCTALSALVITRNAVCPLQNINCFTNTPIEAGTGFIYVQDRLVEQYKVTTGWSTYAAQIKPRSELP